MSKKALNDSSQAIWKKSELHLGLIAKDWTLICSKNRRNSFKIYVWPLILPGEYLPLKFFGLLPLYCQKLSRGLANTGSCIYKDGNCMWKMISFDYDSITSAHSVTVPVCVCPWLPGKSQMFSSTLNYGYWKTTTHPCWQPSLVSQ